MLDIIVGDEVRFTKAQSLGVINDVAVCIFSFTFQAVELRIICCYSRLTPLLVGLKRPRDLVTMKVDCQNEQLIHSVRLENLLGPVREGSRQLLPIILNIFTLGCFFHLMVPIM